MPERRSEHIIPQDVDQENKQGSSFRTTDILSVARALWPDRVVIKFGERNITYETLYEKSTKIAHGLSKIGVGRGDRVAMLSGNSPEYIQAYFATALLGAEFVPLNFRSKHDQLTYMLNIVHAKVLLYADRNRQDAQAIRKDINPNIQYVSLGTDMEKKLEGELSYQDFINQEEADEINDPNGTDEDVTVIMFTSGTTSFPKAVEQQHRSFTELLSFPEDLEKQETILITTPLFHVAALQGVFSSIAEGRTMVLLPDIKPESLLQALANGVQRATLVPTQIEQIISHPDFPKHDLSNLRQITYGGSQMPLNVILEAIKKLSQVSFVRAYGLTETGGTVAVLGSEAHKITGHETEAELRKKQYVLTYGIGKPIEGVKITIVDDAGNEIPPREDENGGELGRITIRTNRVMKGYLGRQKETKDILDGNTLTTSDLGWIDNEGNVYCMGRADDMIIRGGEKIPPAEVETILLGNPEIADAGVIGISDNEWGQAVAAVIVLNTGSKATQQEIIEFCRERLGSSKSPARIIFTKELPRNAMGKLVRKDLQRLFVSS
ncbi:MAG: class I adenylate-forming enzyme family protein [Candidatus Levybacteria bacterium]|nr:class I adenylate-forming enzyme family protein [Candidatus Levybacteria bacterium]